MYQQNLGLPVGVIVELLLEFNANLLEELRDESSLTSVALDELAFERLAATLEGEAEIETSEHCAWSGTDT